MEFLNVLQYLNNTTLAVLFIVGGFFYFFVFKPKNKNEQAVADKIALIPSHLETELLIETVFAKIDKPNYDLLFLQIKDHLMESNVETFRRFDEILKNATKEYSSYVEDVKLSCPKIIAKLDEIEKLAINIQSVVFSLTNNVDTNQSISEADKEIGIIALNDLVSLTGTIENLLEYLIVEMSKKKLIEEIDSRKMDDIKNKLQSNRNSANIIMDLLLQNSSLGRNQSKLNKIINR